MPKCGWEHDLAEKWRCKVWSGMIGSEKIKLT
jgi:hypothetical protein